MARWVLTVGVLCLLPDGRRSYVSCMKLVGFGYDLLCRFNGSQVIQLL